MAMNKNYIIIVVGFVLYGFSLVYYKLSGGPFFPISGFMHAILFSLAFLSAGFVYKAYQQTGNEAHKYFAYAFWLWGICGGLVGLAHSLVYDNPQLFGYGLNAVLIPLFIGAAYFLRVPLQLERKVFFGKVAFWLVIVYGLIVDVFNVFNPVQVFALKNGLIDVQFSSVMGGNAAFLSFGAVIMLTFFYFLYKALTASDRVVMVRSLLISFGILVSSLHEVTHGLGVHNQIFSGSLDGLAGVGMLLVAAGILYKAKQETPSVVSAV